MSLAGGASGQPLDVGGAIALSPAGDGIDPARERVVVALGPELTVVEPGGCSCDAAGRCHCTASGGAIAAVELARQGAASWTYRITGAALPAGAGTLRLRIGNDWGGVDLATGQALPPPQPALDTGRASQATIGPAGGEVAATSAEGVRALLAVPPGALDADTPLSVTPLLSTPLASGAGLLHPGFELQPGGLRLKVPATLTLDFSATSLDVAGQGILLATSPLSALPQASFAFSAARTVSAAIDHFSPYAAGVPALPFADLAAWADPILQEHRQASLTDLAYLAELLAVQQRIGCSASCLDPAQAAATVRQTLAALVLEACPADTADPSQEALRRWLSVVRLAMQFNVSAPEADACAKSVLHASIDRAATQGLADPAADRHFQRLVDLYGIAQGLGHTDEQAFARTKLELVLRRIIDFVGLTLPLTPSYPSFDRELRYLEKAQQLAFPDLALLARHHVAQGLRELLRLGSEACAQDATRAAGNAMLDRALIYALAADTDPADATLKADLSSALGACRAPLLASMLGAYTVTFSPSGTDTVTETVHLTSAQIDCAYPGAGEGSPDCGSALSRLEASAAVPAQVSVEGASLRLTRTSPHEVVLEGDFAILLHTGGWERRNTGMTTIGLKLPGPGVLQVDLNPAWQTGPAGIDCVEDLGGNPYTSWYATHPDAVLSTTGAEWSQFRTFLVSCPLAGAVAGSGWIARFRYLPPP
jgi:hypothetical protein